jgi:hypothetical protein
MENLNDFEKGTSTTTLSIEYKNKKDDEPFGDLCITKHHICITSNTIWRKGEHSLMLQLNLDGWTL